MEEALRKHSGLTALDVAAGCGRASVISCLVKAFGVTEFLRVSENHPLHLAVETNCAEGLRVLLESGAEVEEYAAEGKEAPWCGTLLQHAARSDKSLDCLKLLIEKGANLGYTEYTKKSALHIAAEKDADECLQELICHGANVEGRNQECQTPLLVALWHDSLECLALLLDNGADPNVKDNLDMTPLGIATWKASLGAMAVLIHHKADVNQVSSVYGEEMAPIHIACIETFDEKNSKLAYLRISCLEFHPEVQINAKVPGSQETVLHLLTKEGKHEMLYRFIEVHNPNLEEVDYRGHTAVVYAIGNSRPDCLEVLLHRGASLEGKGVALHFVTSVSAIDTLRCVSLIANLGVDLNHIHDFHLPAFGSIQTTPLCRAVILNMLIYAMFLLEEGADVDYVDGEGRTALHYCALARHEMFAMVLLKKGADPAARQKFGSGDTPLHIAARNGDTRLVRLLLEHDPNLHTIHNKRGQTPFQVAAFNLHGASAGFIAHKETLVECQSMSKFQTPSGTALAKLEDGSFRTDFHQMVALLQNQQDLPTPNEAAQVSSYLGPELNINGCVAAAITLIRGGAETWDKLCEAVEQLSTAESMLALKVFLTVAIIVNDLSAVELILSKKALDINSDLNQLSFLSVIKGRSNSLEILAELVQNGADVDSVDRYGRTALYQAVRYGLVENVEFLLNKGASHLIVENREGFTLLHEAALNGHLCILESLLDRSTANVNANTKYGASPIHLAALSGSSAAISILLERGADIHQKDNLESGALHYAAMGDDGGEAMEVLLKQGLDHSASDADGNTPLHLAAAHGNTSAIKVLLQSGCSIEARNKELTTPFYLACRNQAGEALEILAKGGAGINAKNTVKWETALHHCARADLNKEAAFLLEKSRGDRLLPDKLGFYPLEVAAQCDSAKVGMLLLERVKDQSHRVNWRVNCHYEGTSTKKRHFLHLAKKNERESDEFLRAMTVPERPFRPGVPHLNRKRTRLHPFLDKVDETNRDEVDIPVP